MLLQMAFRKVLDINKQHISSHWDLIVSLVISAFFAVMPLLTSFS